jgi:hypothetical protein
MSQFHDRYEDIARQDGCRLGAGESQADHRRDDSIREAEASQRQRWLRFLALQIARDILQQSSVKEDGTP